MAKFRRPILQPLTIMERYPCYRAEGTYRELGQQHGEQAQDQIAAHLEFMCSSMKFSRAELQRRALAFQPLCDTGAMPEPV